MALQNPPPALASAISQASQTYNVPPDVLTGIWRVESGSSYPNPYVNSLGYGGLFGTKHWNTSTQDQANTAASILSNLLVQDNGHLDEALRQYSGGGYSSVPGETTFGILSPGGSFGGVQTGAPGPNPAQVSGDCPGLWCYLPGAALINSKCASCPKRGNKTVQDAANTVKDATVGGWNAITTVVGKVLEFFQNIVGYLKRGGLIAGGALLVILGIALIGREAASA